MRKTQTGMSLLSLMIGVTIAGILASSAIPGFTHFFHRSELHKARSQLLLWQGEQVRYRLGNNKYAEKKLLTTPSPKGFQFSVENVTAVTYKMKAKRKKKLADGCDEISLNQSGKTSPPECW
ncbi:type IV pilin protein [Aestuariibacter sp. A3R04]|uniref:type IV pilin protein n=1 Tax=Aestuariibacter sp. A3R04 TaxID=2841571 RepID=UPI001C0A3BE3|nr:type IV pilin protein [Aestuariibacter sp. A3R04]MBU3021867.1 hypothetical protein [Aestuariibacter sp. A3R04]